MHTTRRWLIGGMATIALLLLILVVYRPILGLYYQQSAGKEMAPLVITSLHHFFDATPCLMLVQNDAGSTERIEKALADLEKAIMYSPYASQSFLEMGKAYCLLGDFQKAVEAYRRYVELRPKNPLGHLNAGSALLAACQSDSSSVLAVSDTPCGTPRYIHTVASEFSLAGVDADQFLRQARASFDAGEFRVADLFYSGAILTNSTLSAEDRFSWRLARLVDGMSSNENADPTIKVHLISDQIQINARDLTWTNGTPVSESPSEGLGSATLFWNGAIFAPVNVTQAGQYRLTVKAKNSAPPPIRIQVERNFSSQAVLEFIRGDSSWQEVGTDILLSSGIQLIGIRFINDEVVNGVDRNAVIDWIRVERINPEQPRN